MQLYSSKRTRTVGGFYTSTYIRVRQVLSTLLQQMWSKDGLNLCHEAISTKIELAECSLRIFWGTEAVNSGAA